jgi:bacterioferritin
MLLSAFADGGNAELTAIAQYLNHSDTISDKSLSDMIFCIALVEMQHLDLVGTMIESLGGDLRYWRPNRAYWSGGEVDYGHSDCEKISLDIKAEQDALNGYEELLRNLYHMDGPGADQVEQVIRRIMEDEMFHLEMFKEAYSRYCC